jgi:hypothetical protein
MRITPSPSASARVLRRLTEPERQRDAPIDKSFFGYGGGLSNIFNQRGKAVNEKTPAG